MSKSGKATTFPPNDGYHHYYVRDINHHPIACVVFKGIEGGKVVRGISICSPAENGFNREKGRGIALARCKRAEASKVTGEEIKTFRFAVKQNVATCVFLVYGAEFRQTVVNPDSRFGEVTGYFKSAWNDNPTPREQRILEIDEKIKAKDQVYNQIKNQVWSQVHNPIHDKDQIKNFEINEKIKAQKFNF